jgi:putative ABC transport system permease protein
VGTGSISDVRAVLAGALVQNRLRSAVVVAAIAVGVALGLAVQVVNQSAIDTLTQGVRTLSGEADLAVRGPREGFDERLYAVLARDRDVAIASPIVDVQVRVRGVDEPLRVLGIDAFRAAALQPAIVGDASDRLDTLREDTIFLSNAAIRALDRRTGDRIAVDGGARDFELRIAGTLVGAPGERLATMDIAGAQVAFGWIGRLSRIELRLREGASPAAFIERITSALPAGVVVAPPQAQLDATQTISRSYRVNLNVLALVALFTGGLLVFTTQALGVVRRRTQFALLRTLGVTRGRLAQLCVLEGALVGAFGSIIGVALGYALARVALRIAGGDLGAGYFQGVDSDVTLDASTALVFFALGVGTAVVGSLVPARAAARTPIAQALRAGDDAHALVRSRPAWPGIVVVACGVALLALPPVRGLPLAGYAAIACLLVGALLALPALATQVLARMRITRSMPASLALAQLRGTPGQVGLSLASIVASISLMVSMAIMVTSFRTSLDEWLVRVLPADLYARVTSNDVAPLSAEEQASIAALPGVARAEFVREAQLLLNASRPRIVLLARPLDEASAATRLVLMGPAASRPPDAPPPIWVNEAMVDLYDFSPGRVVSLPLFGREARFFVAGVWRDYGRPQGAVQIDRDVYAALTGDARATSAALWLATGTDAERLRRAVQDALPGSDRLEISAASEIRVLALRAFDRTFAVTYALEAAAIAIGLAGLSSAFGGLVLARRREFGVLRHLGMTRRQVGAMLASEGLVTAGIGVVVGGSLGGLISLVLVHVVNRQSFHWGMDVHVPWSELALLAIAIVVLATLTAVVSGRQAMSRDVVGAVREDW